jgi:hypothetical protein
MGSRTSYGSGCVSVRCSAMSRVSGPSSSRSPTRPAHPDRPACGPVAGQAPPARRGHAACATPRSTTSTTPRGVAAHPCRPCPAARTRPAPPSLYVAEYCRERFARAGTSGSGSSLMPPVWTTPGTAIGLHRMVSLPHPQDTSITSGTVPHAMLTERDRRVTASHPSAADRCQGPWPTTAQRPAPPAAAGRSSARRRHRPSQPSKPWRYRLIDDHPMAAPRSSPQDAPAREPIERDWTVICSRDSAV